MSEKILVPALGESITEATVAKWLKSVGDNIEADEPIVELETDKVNLEVPSPVKGFLGSINAKNGQTVEVGSVLGSINAGANQTNQVETVEKEISPLEQENKVINLKTEKKVELKIFDEKEEEEENKEEENKEEENKEEDNDKNNKSISKIGKKTSTDKDCTSCCLIC